MLSDRESNWSLKESIDYQRATDRPLARGTKGNTKLLGGSAHCRYICVVLYDTEVAIFSCCF